MPTVSLKNERNQFATDDVSHLRRIWGETNEESKLHVKTVFLLIFWPIIFLDVEYFFGKIEQKIWNNAIDKHMMDNFRLEMTIYLWNQTYLNKSVQTITYYVIFVWYMTDKHKFI